jgi:ABC-type polysaccharide/polyol phosphate export permease
MDNIKMMTKMAPLMNEFQKWGKMTAREFAQRFNQC